MTDELRSLLSNLADLAREASDEPNAAVRRLMLSEAWFVLQDAQDANNALLMDPRSVEHTLATQRLEAQP